MFHFEYLKRLEDLKDAYAPFDPDAETKPLHPVSPDERDKDEEQLFDKFAALMERANFKRLSREEMQRALQEVASVSGVQMQVDLSMFIRLEVFVRGDVHGQASSSLMEKIVAQGRNPRPALSASGPDRETETTQAFGRASTPRRCT